jgi:hypothetical protein
MSVHTLAITFVQGMSRHQYLIIARNSTKNQVEFLVFLTRNSAEVAVLAGPFLRP